MGPVAGTIAGIGILLICIIILAVLALVVVKALVGSPWGTFAVFSTIPIAILMGIYSQYIRPGRIGEMSVLGAVLLLAALIYGRTVAETPALAAYFNLSGETLALTIIGYGFVASVLPVWLLLAPRDYLSTFLKIGTITLLAIGGDDRRQRDPSRRLFRHEQLGRPHRHDSRSCGAGDLLLGLHRDP
jgi:carbon starvation protein